jgi:hypothetical protein
VKGERRGRRGSGGRWWLWQVCEMKVRAKREKAGAVVQRVCEMLWRFNSRRCRPARMMLWRFNSRGCRPARLPAYAGACPRRAALTPMPGFGGWVGMGWVGGWVDAVGGRGS